jgi:hypothetical protein
LLCLHYKDQPVMLRKEIIAVYANNHMKHKVHSVGFLLLEGL